VALHVLAAWWTHLGSPNCLTIVQLADIEESAQRLDNLSKLSMRLVLLALVGTRGLLMHGIHLQ